MIIRPARERDVEALARLAAELGYPSTADEMRERLAALRAGEDDEVLVADVDGEVAGWIHLAIVLSLESGRYAEIEGLVVTEARRGSGIGAELVRAAEAWGRTRGVKRLRVRTNVTRTRTHLFYERGGFAHVKTSRVYEKGL
jgi:N-acetylglutamate synthase-like GNAT family acetyltransferase